MPDWTARKKEIPYGIPRKKGTRNKVTLQRLAKMRQLIAMGLSDFEIKERLELTGDQFSHLREVHLQESKGDSNLSFWIRYKDKQALRYREAMRALGYFHGVDNPHRKVDAQGRFTDPTDAFLVPPMVQTLQAIRLMADLDNQELEVGLRLNVFQREPERVDVTVRNVEDMTDEELQASLRVTARRAAEALGRSEGEVMAFLTAGRRRGADGADGADGAGRVIDVDASAVGGVAVEGEGIQEAGDGGTEEGC
jgi:hypothetical protein